MTRSLRLSELLCSVEAAATGWGASTPFRAAPRGVPGGRVASTDAARRPAVNGGDPAQSRGGNRLGSRVCGGGRPVIPYDSANREQQQFQLVVSWVGSLSE